MSNAPRIRIFEIPAQLKEMSPPCTAIVIDVLRATSSMLTALHNGCGAIYPVVSVEDAFDLKNQPGYEESLLCGERKGVRVEGFDLGNSPFEYTAERVNGRSLIWTTTNGTRAMDAAKGADRVLIASLLNVSATAQAAVAAGTNVDIICAGTNGEPTLEDSICAGLIAAELLNMNDGFKIDGTVESLIEQATKHQSDLYAMFLLSQHARLLQSIGFEKDLSYCAQLNKLSLIALLNKGIVKSVS